MQKIPIVLTLACVFMTAMPYSSYADKRVACGTPFECYQKALEKLEQARKLVKAQQAENARLLKEQQAENQRLANDNKRQALENQRLVLENQRLVLENQQVVVDSQKKIGAIETQLENRLQKLKIGNCKQISGSCGFGTFNNPTLYLDRVAYSCPNERPILKTFRFIRCGNLGTSDEGLLIRATCCAILY